MNVALVIDNDRSANEEQVNLLGQALASNPKIRVRVTRERVFTDPDAAYDYAKRHETFVQKDMQKQTIDTGSVKVIKRSPRADLAMTKILILDFMNARPKEKVFTKQDFVPLFQRWRYSENTISCLLSKLAATGHVIRVGYGRYMVSE